MLRCLGQGSKCKGLDGSTEKSHGGWAEPGRGMVEERPKNEDGLATASLPPNPRAMGTPRGFTHRRGGIRPCSAARWQMNRD